jgi:hypothetical protein
MACLSLKHFSILNIQGGNVLQFLLDDIGINPQKQARGLWAVSPIGDNETEEGRIKTEGLK